jgi:hypothetical protein
MRDPEMLFEVVETDDSGTLVYDPTLIPELGAFSATWDRNLAAQGSLGTSRQ